MCGRSGLPVPMSFYRGKVLLIVNVASQCGYTDSTYAYLNKLHTKYSSKGLSILAFPCNQFGHQEPGDASQILNFATKVKRAKFDFFRKVEVNGANAHPLFKFLRGEQETDCVDADTNCDAWAAAGECEKNSGVRTCPACILAQSHRRAQRCRVQLQTSWLVRASFLASSASPPQALAHLSVGISRAS